MAGATSPLSSAVDGESVERDDVLAADLSPGDPRALVQVMAGVEAIQAYLARTPDVLTNPTAKLARDAMVRLAVAGVMDSDADAELVRRIYRTVFPKQLLYGLVLARVIYALENLKGVEGGARTAVVDDLRSRLVVIDDGFSVLNVARLELMLRKSALGARGATKHGAAYTAANIALSVNAFGLRTKPGEKKGDAVERVTKLFRESARSGRARTHKREL